MTDMTLEEALAAATVDEELVTPVNEVLLINPETRTINVPDSEKLFGARQDMDVERKYFKCPRIVGDNIDLFEHRIFVNYVPSKRDGSYDAKEDVQSYWCKDLAVEGDFVTFSWKLSENVTRSAGYIAFAVYAKTIDEYGNLQTKWHTTIAIGNVLDTLPDGEEWVTIYPDIVMQLLGRMDALENGETLHNVLYSEQALTEEQKAQARKNIGAADAAEVGKLSEEKVSNPSTGEVGQILEIESVDENGKPKTYKAVNKPTGGEVSDEQIVEAVENYLTENPIKVDLSDYAKKNELPTVPTKVSAFENDKGYLTEHQSLEGYAKTSDIPTDYAKENHTHSEYLTEHQDISGKQDKLVSGENIKTINGNSLLGSGDIAIQGGSSGGSDWSLLNSVETTEEVNSIEISTDSEGNTFSLENVRVFVYCPFDPTDGAKGKISCKATWNTFTSSSLDLVSSVFNCNKRNTYQIEHLRGDKINCSIKTTTNYGNHSFFEAMDKYKTFPVINVKVALDDTTKTFPIGTIVEVYKK